MITSPSTATRSTRPTRCARCDAPTVSIREAVPWCGDCEWNLDHYQPAPGQVRFGWGWVDRRLSAIAHRLTRRQFAELAAGGGAGTGAARVVLIAVSILLLAAFGLLMVGTAWLFWTFPLVSPATLLGLLGLALLVLLRPRLGRLDPRVRVLDPDRAPELVRLVADVSAAIGVRPPHVVALDTHFSAYATAVGPRRRRVLCLGLPLWAALRPQERVALLGHELGHFANGDIRRGLLTQPAFTMLGRAAEVMSPVPGASGDAGFIGLIAGLVAHVVQWVLSRLLLLGHLLLLWVGLRDGQRAEYRADEMASVVAGSDAAVGLLDALSGIEVVEMMVRREARAGLGPDAWLRTVTRARADGASRLPLLRQFSIRHQVSLFASHPPSGLRARLLEARPAREPLVVLDETRGARIEAELAEDYTRLRRELALSG